MAETRTKMKRYCFLDLQTNKIFVKPRLFGGPAYCLCGIVEGRPELSSTTVITTEQVVRIRKNVVKTKDGHEYEIGQPLLDYQDFLEAKKKKVPILRNWCITTYPNKKYVMVGETDKYVIREEIREQHDNYVVLGDGKEYFVMWSDVSKEMLRYPEGEEENNLTKLGYPEGFSRFGHKISRPKLF